jgi:competence CoiA-like predicted nuclease
LFDNGRNLNKRDEIINIYESKWLYHACFSPVWTYRIENYDGIINHSTKTVVFPDDDSMEEFYLNYGYEPDEQPREIQNKSIGYFANRPEMYEGKTWKTFYEKYGKNGLYVVE